MIIKNGGAIKPLADSKIESIGWNGASGTSYYTLSVQRRDDGSKRDGPRYMHVTLTQLEMERVMEKWIQFRVYDSVPQNFKP
jgi:hypothetical protein